jgi:hypothetical protein
MTQQAPAACNLGTGVHHLGLPHVLQVVGNNVLFVALCISLDRLQ